MTIVFSTMLLFQPSPALTTHTSTNSIQSNLGFFCHAPKIFQPLPTPQFQKPL